VHDVFVWDKGPFLYRTVLVPVDSLAGERQAKDGEVKRLGDTPVVERFTSGDATLEVAAKAEDRALVTPALLTEQEGGTSRD
jgi:hypothetical protein